MKKTLCLDCQKLFNLAERSGDSLKIENELYTFLRLYKENPALKEALHSPRLNDRQKSKILSEVCPDLSLAALEIIKLFIENHQLPRLYAFFRSFCTLIENKKNLLLGEFVTALPVPAAYLKQAETILSDRSGKPVSLKSKVDPKILGGFVIKLLNHKMIDASLRQNLASLKNCMSKEMQA